MASQIAATAFDEVDRHLNRWNSRSELSRLNRLAPDIDFATSPLLHQMLQLADRAVRISEGRFDPTVEPACRLWRNRLEGGGVPSSSDLLKLRARTGWYQLQLRAKGVVRKRAGVELDFGGIAKGFCVDLIAQRLQRAGIVNFLVDWGGEICARGQHPSGRRWNIGICKPKGDRDHLVESLVERLQLGDAAVATSGSDKQFWIAGESAAGFRRYSHIVDPRSLQAVQADEERPETCSVLCDQCALADGLATAGMLFETVEEAAEWFCQLDTVESGFAWIASPKQTARVAFGRSKRSQGLTTGKLADLSTPVERESPPLHAHALQRHLHELLESRSLQSCARGDNLASGQKSSPNSPLVSLVKPAAKFID